MRILVLEDSTERVKYFIERFSEHEITVTENADDAVVYLNTDVYDYIFLDHDLGLNNGSGTDVAAFLSSGMSINNDAIVIIHSWNVPAVGIMRALLPKAYVFPYGSVEFRSLKLCTRGS